MKMGITPGVLCPVLGSSVQERLDILERLQRRATKMVMGLEQLTNIGILMVLRPFNLEEIRFSKDFICAHEYSQAVCKDRARPFSSSAHWQDQRHWAQTETQEAPSEYQETLWGPLTTDTVPREAEKSYTLEIYKVCLDIVLSIQLCLSRGAEADDLQKYLPISNTLSVKVPNLACSLLTLRKISIIFTCVILVFSIWCSVNPYR